MCPSLCWWLRPLCPVEWCYTYVYILTFTFIFTFTYTHWLWTECRRVGYHNNIIIYYMILNRHYSEITGVGNDILNHHQLDYLSSSFFRLTSNVKDLHYGPWWGEFTSDLHKGPIMRKKHHYQEHKNENCKTHIRIWICTHKDNPRYKMVTCMEIHCWYNIFHEKNFDLLHRTPGPNASR